MKDTQSSSLIKALVEDINKKYKTADNVAFVLDGSELAPSDVKEWVSTGSSVLDLAISNRPYGGFPVGRITEISGLEQSGKTLLAVHGLKSTQQKGGLAVYIDTENALAREFIEAIGVDLSKMLYLQLETVEDVFDTIEGIVEKVRKVDRNRLVTIVVDSIMGASTKVEIAAEYDKDGYATTKAIVLSKAMRKITNYLGRERICLILTNQLRTKMGISFGDPYTTSGGKAVAFHSSVRVRLKSVGQIKLKEKVVGAVTKAQVVKNRLGPPLRTVEYSMYFDSGIDDYGSWLTVLKDNKIVSQANAWYTYPVVNRETGEVLKEIKFQSKDFYSKLILEENLRDEIYDQICEKLILKYKLNDSSSTGEGIGIDDISIDENFVEEDA
jgi:recombination protein RecA